MGEASFSGAMQTPDSGHTLIGLSEGPMDDDKERDDPLERDHNLAVVLPGGLEKTTTVHGSKPVMDLLVTLCARYHLNPSDHSVELLSANRNQITYKPNSPIGSLDADKILLKPKETDEKIIRKPYMPEATVRLLINYKTSHKAVVRVNPRVPLEQLLSAVCEKCEFDVESTILLRNSDSQEPLDLTKSLNDYGVRELFAKDTAAVTPTDAVPSPSPPPPQEACVEDAILSKREEKKRKEGFFSLFRRSKSREALEKEVSQSAPTSPVVKEHPRAKTLNCFLSSNNLLADSPKKRRAPLPPISASRSIPVNLDSHHLDARPLGLPDGQTLKRTKRRAPPPPGANPDNTLPQDAGPKGSEASLYTVEELESEVTDTPSSASLSSCNSGFCPTGKDNNPFPHTAYSRGRAVPPASLILAEILTTSLANGRPVRSSKSMSAIPKSSSVCKDSSTQSLPHNGTLFSATSPLKLRPTPKGGSLRDGLTTFTVVPRGSMIRERMFELEQSVANGSELVPMQENPKALPAVDSVKSSESQTDTPGMLGSPQHPEAEPKLPKSDCESCPSAGFITDFPYPLPVLSSSETRPSQLSPSPAEETERGLDRLATEEDQKRLTTAEDPERPVTEEDPEQPVTEEDPEQPVTEEGPEKPATEDGPERPVTRQDPERPVTGEGSEKPATADSLEGSPTGKPVPPTTTPLASILPHSNGTPLKDIPSTMEHEASNETFQSVCKEALNTAMVSQCHQEEDEEEEFPPPPSPVFFEDDVEEGEGCSSQKREDFSVMAGPVNGGPINGECRGDAPRVALPGKKVTEFGGKLLKRTGTVPSRFAQAVARAVQRSQTGVAAEGQSPQGGSSTSPCPCTSTEPEWLPSGTLNGSSCLG